MAKSGKEALLEWCKRQVSASNPEIPVDNFRESFADGRVLCVLVNTVWPKSLDISSLNPKQAAENLEKAFSVADLHGVSRLLEVEEVVSAASEKSLAEVEPQLITYITQFFQIWKASNRGTINSRQSTLFKQQQARCAKCNENLALIKIECGGKHYHPDCFTCTLCKQKLTSSCVNIEDHPYCDSCGKKAFKMQTWKVHKKQKENWWNDMWRNSQMPTEVDRTVEGWNKDGGAEKKERPIPPPRTIGKLPPSNDEQEETSVITGVRKFTVPKGQNGETDSSKYRRSVKPPVSGSGSGSGSGAGADANTNTNDSNNTNDSYNAESEDAEYTTAEYTTSESGGAEEYEEIGVDDELLKQYIDDETEREAFISLFDTLPEPDSIPIHLSLARDSVALASAPTDAILAAQQQQADQLNNNINNSDNNNGNNTPVSAVANSPLLKENSARRASKPLPMLPPGATPSPTSSPSIARQSIMVNPHNNQQQLSTNSPTSSPSSRHSVMVTNNNTINNNTINNNTSNNNTHNSVVHNTVVMTSSPAPTSPAPSSPKVATDNEPPIKEGYLVKKTDVGIVKLWQKRYFLLKRDQLLYFMDKEAREKGLTLGIIPLKSVSNVGPMPSKNSKKATTRFMLEGDNISWFLKSETEREMIDWMAAIKSAGKVENEKKLVTLTSAAGLSMNSFFTRKEGALEVRHQATWVTRWIVLRDGVLYEYKNKESGGLRGKIPLFEAQLREYVPTKGFLGNLIDWTSNEQMKNCFEVFTTTRQMIFKCKDQEIMHDWLNAILRQKVGMEEILDTVALEPLSLE